MDNGGANPVRVIQIASAILLLVAGQLWSQKLARQVLVEGIEQANDSTEEQEELFTDRIAKKTDPYELAATGKKLLYSNNARFAVIPLKQATSLAPNYRDAWFLLGYAELQVTNETVSAKKSNEKLVHRQRAITALRAAIKIDPNHQPSRDLLKQLITTPKSE